jgi:hypothetical protein
VASLPVDLDGLRHEGDEDGEHSLRHDLGKHGAAVAKQTRGEGERPGVAVQVYSQKQTLETSFHISGSGVETRRFYSKLRGNDWIQLVQPHPGVEFLAVALRRVRCVDRGVAPQVDPIERQTLKPGYHFAGARVESKGLKTYFHFIGSRVETRQIQAIGQLSSTCTGPLPRELRGR